MNLDALIIGGGVIGASVAYHLGRRYHGRFVVLEKEVLHGLHTSHSYRNSGTVHDGATEGYKPGTKKYAWSPDASRKLRMYANEVQKRTGQRITKTVGKFVLAPSDTAYERLREMEAAARHQGFDVAILDRSALEKVEPGIIQGRRKDEEVLALYHPMACILDSSGYVNSLVSKAKQERVEFVYEEYVKKVKKAKGFEVVTQSATYHANYLVNCAGIHAITIAHQLGIGEDYTLIPLRGDFYEIVGDKSDIVRSMVYQFPEHPFSLQHIHPDMKGRLFAGPLALAIPGMELYKGQPLDIPVKNRFYLKELFQATLRFPGFYKLLSQKEFWALFCQEAKKSFLPEWLATRYFLQDAQKLLPSLGLGNLRRSLRSGIRAQPLDKNGNFLHDIEILEGDYSSHYFSPSPALSLSLYLGEMESQRIAKKLGLRPKD